eukprot:396069-Pelagomonas_calceolata.AAC.1
MAMGSLSHNSVSISSLSLSGLLCHIRAEQPNVMAEGLNPIVTIVWVGPSREIKLEFYFPHKFPFDPDLLI